MRTSSLILVLLSYPLYIIVYSLIHCLSSYLWGYDSCHTLIYGFTCGISGTQSGIGFYSTLLGIKLLMYGFMFLKRIKLQLLDFYLIAFLVFDAVGIPAVAYDYFLGWERHFMRAHFFPISFMHDLSLSIGTLWWSVPIVITLGLGIILRHKLTKLIRFSYLLTVLLSLVLGIAAVKIFLATWL